MPPKRKAQQAANNAAAAATNQTDAVPQGERDTLIKELNEMPDIFSISIAPKFEGSLEESPLLITHIDAENFKSYFGKQTIGPFHHVSYSWHK